MQIGAKKAVTFHYKLRDDEGTELDSSEGAEPLTYLHGEGNIVPGLEKALDGEAAGRRGEGEGVARRGLRRARREKYPERPAAQAARGQDCSPGCGCGCRRTRGRSSRWLTAIKGDYVTIDTNHPLAGMNLHFDVKVVEVREATAEELEHGHVHGPGGHH